jgi:hypothetical protein
MGNIALDFDKLLGFKVTLRALRAMQVEIGQSANAHGDEAGAIEYHSAILRSRIGSKPLEGLRYRCAA